MTTTELINGAGPTGRSRLGRLLGAAGWQLRIGVPAVLLLVGVALLAPFLTPFDPTKTDAAMALRGPNATHLLGTDQLGRDILSRVLFGARIDLLIGTVGVTIPLVFGALIGLVSGYRGGLLDAVVGRIIDVVVAFPFLVLVIAIVAALGPGLGSLFVAISLVSWVAYARIIRAETLVARSREYILAGRALGYSDARLMLRHILPNAIAPALVFAMSDFILDIVAGASLGFFGLGVPAPTPEWGVMIAEGRDFMLTSPWVAIFPGLAIIIVGFVFSLLGDGLADLVRRVDARG
jgi:peptide/nickel transport system permease protein